MLKKHFGGLTLFIFTLTFAVPLLVGVNISDAGPTQVFEQPWRTDFYCPDGTFATSSRPHFFFCISKYMKPSLTLCIFPRCHIANGRWCWETALDIDRSPRIGGFDDPLTHF